MDMAFVNFGGYQAAAHCTHTLFTGGHLCAQRSIRVETSTIGRRGARSPCMVSDETNAGGVDAPVEQGSQTPIEAERNAAQSIADDVAEFVSSSTATAEDAVGVLTGSTGATDEDATATLGTEGEGFDESEFDFDESEIIPLEPIAAYRNDQAIKSARERFRLHEHDSGSPEAQIAVLTTKIAYLTDHLKVHRKDFSATRGLVKMVATRRRLLKYVKREDPARFEKIVKDLNIRVSQKLRAV